MIISPSPNASAALMLHLLLLLLWILLIIVIRPWCSRWKLLLLILLRMLTDIIGSNFCFLSFIFPLWNYVIIVIIIVVVVIIILFSDVIRMSTPIMSKQCGQHRS